MKKKFKDTKVGKFLIGKGGVFTSLTDSIPDKGLLGLVKNLINKDESMPQQDKETALKLLEMDNNELVEITKRWESDNKSDSSLAKNVRPLSLIFLTISLIVFILLDGFDINFGVDSGWIDLIKSLLITVYLSYFDYNEEDKFKNIYKK